MLGGGADEGVRCRGQSCFLLRVISTPSSTHLSTEVTLQERHLEGSLSLDWMGIRRSSGLWVWKEGGAPSTGLKDGQDITECLFVQSVQKFISSRVFPGRCLPVCTAFSLELAGLLIVEFF